MRLHAVYKYKGILLVERPMHTNAAQERGNSPRELNQIVLCFPTPRNTLFVRPLVRLFVTFFTPFTVNDSSCCRTSDGEKRKGERGVGPTNVSAPH